MQEAARILYEGPWIAERWAAVGEFAEKHPNDIYPVTWKILNESENQLYRATELFQAIHRLQSLKNRSMKDLEDAVLVLPTTGGTWTIQQAEEDPIRTNQMLGLYTNHCNLQITQRQMFRITLFSRFDQEHLLKGLTTIFERGETIPLAVCGLHIRGFPLEHQMLACQATFRSQTKTAPNYKLYQLETNPIKPGLVRSDEGQAIEVEIWDMPVSQLGIFMQFQHHLV